MAAIGRVLEARSETFILLNAADLAAGGTYLIVLLTFAQRLLLIVASLSKRIRALTGAYELGEYVLLVFCVAMGSLADARLLGGGSMMLALFVVLVMGPGLTLGLAGLALGNYLGLATAWGLRWLAGG